LSGKFYPTNALKAAWERVLLNQFHDILPGSSIHPVYRDAKDMYLEAQNIAGNQLRSGLAALIKNVDTASGPQGIPVILFNTLGWERDDVARVKLPAGTGKELRVLTAAGEEIPSQIYSTVEGRYLCFTAKKMPALGYRVYKIQQAKPQVYSGSLQVEQNTLENRYFRIKIHKDTGNISRIYDKTANREVLARDQQANLFQLFEDLPKNWDAWNIGYTGREWSLDKADQVLTGKKGPVMGSLLVKKSFLGLSKARREPTSDFPSSFFLQEIILYEDLPIIEFKIQADWWEEHVLLKAAFPVDIKSERATYEIPFAAIERPTSRNTPWEKARFEVPAIRWADLSGDDYGVSLINESKYGYDIKDNVMRLSLLRSPVWPDPLADRGKHIFSYALFPHAGGWREAGTVQRGYAFNTPLLTVLTGSHKGSLPPELSYMSAGPGNIVLAALKKAEDRQSLVLRLYEAEGRKTEALLSFFREPKEIHELDLMENRLKSIPVSGKNISLKFGKFEIRSLELVF
jgi:alpha-mannosidase